MGHLALKVQLHGQVDTSKAATLVADEGMPLVVDQEEFDHFEHDLDVVLRLQDILLQAAEGLRDGPIDVEYRSLRRAVLQDDTYTEVIPKFVRRHRDLGSMWPAFKSFSPQWEPRRQEVREQFEPLLQTAERVTFFNNLADSQADEDLARNPRYDASAWTGAKKPAERLVAVKTLIPVAQAAVEQLIASLEMPNHNGAPQLDEVEEAIIQLRGLHTALGEVLQAAEDGRLSETFNGGLPTEAARYAKRAAKALKNDPIPYALSGTVLAILTTCGFPGIGGFLSGVALSIRKANP